MGNVNNLIRLYIVANGSCLRLDWTSVYSSYSFDVVRCSLCPCIIMYKNGKGRHTCMCVGKVLMAFLHNRAAELHEILTVFSHQK